MEYNKMKRSPKNVPWLPIQGTSVLTKLPYLYCVEVRTVCMRTLKGPNRLRVDYIERLFCAQFFLVFDP